MQGRGRLSQSEGYSGRSHRSLRGLAFQGFTGFKVAVTLGTCAISAPHVSIEQSWGATSAPSLLHLLSQEELRSVASTGTTLADKV